MSTPGPLWQRLLGFTLLPAIAAISPMLVLPVISRIAGPSGWSSAIAGETIGTFAAIAIAWGWTSIGPARVSIAADGAARGVLYRESLVVRILIAVIGLPAMGVICWLIAAPGSEWLAVLMGAQGAMIALTFTWFSAGTGNPREIVVYDAVPRLIMTAIAAVVIAQTGIVELYPLAGIAVTIVGTGLFTRRVLRRHRGAWPGARDLPRLLRMNAPVALNDAALGIYSSVPTPLVTVTAPAIPAAGFASADKLLKLGQFLPLTLANALQAWIAEVNGAARGLRIRAALIAHATFGVLGWIVLASLGVWVSEVFFGSESAAAFEVVFALGLAFAFFSLRTSMTRHILFPAGEASGVMYATLLSTAAGVPIMIVLAITIGPVGAAIGYTFTEIAATLLLVRRSVRAYRVLRDTQPIEG